VLYTHVWFEIPARAPRKTFWRASKQQFENASPYTPLHHYALYFSKCTVPSTTLLEDTTTRHYLL